VTRFLSTNYTTQYH